MALPPCIKCCDVLGDFLTFNDPDHRRSVVFDGSPEDDAGLPCLVPRISESCFNPSAKSYDGGVTA